ncbi:hypothetical protein MVES1_000974 [Malassezia vespertilionis]|nr:uncharacterized protein MVES1_000974 [Malassezia vespertilionis]WFD05642.1 hypothetical protein MVES1_000974 [Malassezia vespertilionis]
MHGPVAPLFARRGRVARWRRRAPSMPRACTEALVLWAYTGEACAALPKALSTALSLTLDAALALLADDLGEALLHASVPVDCVEFVLLDTPYCGYIDKTVLACRTHKTHVPPMTAAAALVWRSLVCTGSVPAGTAAPATYMEVARVSDAVGPRCAAPYLAARAWESACALADPAPVFRRMLDDPLVAQDPELGGMLVEGLCAFPAHLPHAEALLAMRRMDLDWVVYTLAASHAPATHAYAPLFCAEVSAMLGTRAWRALLSRNDMAVARLVRILVASMNDVNAASLYETLVGDILLADAPPRPSGELEAALEAYSEEIVRYLRVHWVAVRAQYGFDALAPWCVKELADRLEVEAHALRVHCAAPACVVPLGKNASMFAMTTGGLAQDCEKGTERKPGPVSLHAAVVNKHAAQCAAQTGHV